MKRLRGYWQRNARLLGVVSVSAIGLGWLLLHRLGSLTAGLSRDELRDASMPLGWHGILHDALYLPFKLVQSAVFALQPQHSVLIDRLPSVIVGAVAIVSLSLLVWLWHGTRTAVLTGLLFACGAWTLHVSRLATYEVLYLSVLPLLLLLQALLHRYADKAAVWYLGLLTVGLLIYVPGLIWLIAAWLVLQRKLVMKAWNELSGWRHRAASCLVLIAWWPLLVISLLRNGTWSRWLGAPDHWPGFVAWLKDLANVPVHLFVAGPRQPELWLGRAPLLSVFTLLICALGIYFYAAHWRSSRSRTLAVLSLISWLLISFGSVGLSLLVPVLYVVAATGLAYLLLEWLKVFPINPLARGLGIGLIGAAVAISCFYQLRAYFVAWPHNAATRATFVHPADKP